MSRTGRELVESAFREALEQLGSASHSEAAHTAEVPQPQLPPAAAGSPLANEWERFRREVGRLLAEGFRGRFALIKSDQPITVWDTLRDAVQAGELMYGTEPCLVQQILPYVRALRAG